MEDELEREQINLEFFVCLFKYSHCFGISIIILNEKMDEDLKKD